MNTTISYAHNIATEMQAILTDTLAKAGDLIRQGCFECFDAFVGADKFTNQNAKLAVQMTTERICDYLSSELGNTIEQAVRRSTK